MKIIWWETCLVIFIPLLLLFVISYYRIYLTPKLIPTCEINNIKLETGDLIFIRYESKHGKIIKVVTDSDWSHTAFVYRKNGNVYLIEVADYTNYDEPDVKDLCGLCIIPIDKWLQLNDGRICGYRKCQQPPTNKAVEDLLQQYHHITLDMDLYNWSAILFHTKNKKVPKNNYFCSEFIAFLMQRLGLLDDTINPGYYSPGRLAKADGYSEIKIFYIDV